MLQIKNISVSDMFKGGYFVFVCVMMWVSLCTFLVNVRNRYRRHLFIVVSAVLQKLCSPFHSIWTIVRSFFLCDNVRIIIIQEKRGIVLERAAFQIPFFEASFGWGIGSLALCLCASQFSCKESLAWGATSCRQALSSVEHHGCKGLNLSSLSLSAVMAASSIPPELNIAAAGRGGV